MLWVGDGVRATVQSRGAGLRKRRHLSHPGVLKTHHNGDVNSDNLSSGHHDHIADSHLSCPAVTAQAVPV